jgi:hypothetical protein
MARKPKYQHGIKRGQFADWPAGEATPEAVAERVSYTGHSMHKNYPSPAGPPALRADKAKCAQYPEKQWPRLLVALRLSIRSGCVGQFRGGFPERAWIWINDVLHEARLTNEGIGDYHGFPINDDRQYPLPIDQIEAVPRVEIPVV